MLPIFAGFLAGSAHVISGPDHLAALAPIALDVPQSAQSMGIRWGVGHGMGVLILGGLGIVTQSTFDLNMISIWSESLVGFILIGMGGWAFYKAKGIVIHTHPHDHKHDQIDDDLHAHSFHEHIHIHTQADDHARQTHQGHAHTAFWVGMLHGAAGGGHLLGVLPSLALSPFDACLYLGSYFIAAVLSMAVFATLLGRLSLRQGPQVIQKLMYSVSILVLGVGCMWSYHAWPL